MQLTKTLEKEILDSYNKWLRSYLNGDVETYDSYFDDAYHFIGSTNNEEFLTRKDTTNFFKKTAEQFAGKTDLRNETQTIELFEKLVFITHAFDAWFYNGEDWTYYSRFRFSSVMQKKEKNWKFIYQHFSTTDSKTDEGETIGFDKVNLENHELREAIKRRTFELEEKNRELKVEGALERIRAQAVAMKQSSDLLDIVVTMRNEFIKLGHEAHYFWQMMWLPEKYEKAMTSGDGTKIGFVMELPRHIHGDIPLLAKWEKSKKQTVVYAMNVEEALDYIHKMVTLGDFQNIDPQAPTEDDIRHIGGLTFIMARTSHGEIGYSLPGIVKNPPKEDINILVKFAGAFDLAHRRFLDLQKAEKQRREVQIELALEKVRSRTMGMQGSDELRATALLLFQQVEELGINSFACGFNIWDEDKKFATAWMAGKDRLQPPFKTNSSEDVYLLFHEAEKRGDALFVLEQEGKELEDHYKYLVSIPEVKALAKAGLSFPTFQIIHCAYFKEGYLMFITHESVPDAHDIFIRFAKVFQQTYTRFLDLQKAEAQAKEAQIETALERVRSRSIGMQRSQELSRVVQLLDEELIGLGIESDGTQILTDFDNPEKNVVVWFGIKGQDYLERFHVPYFDHPMRKKIHSAWEKGIDFYTGHYSKTDKNKFFRLLFKNSDFRKTTEERKKFIYDSSGLTRASVLSKNSILIFQRYHLTEFSKEEIEVFKRFGKVFDQTYTRFLDLQKSEAQARESEIELALERVRARSMAMQKSDELKDVIKIVYDQLTQLKINLKHAGFVVDYTPKGDWNFWIADAQDIPSKITHPYFESVWANQFNNAKQKGENFFKTHLNFEEKNTFYKELLSHVPDLPQASIDFYLSCPGLAASTVLFDTIGLYIENFEGIPYTNEENSIVLRFGKVFQQTYTRFLDLQKAEEQTRKAQIEVAVERIRAQSMAMHKTDDLEKVNAEILKQLKLLDINGLSGVSIWFIDDNQFVKIWDLSSPGNMGNQNSYQVSYDATKFDILGEPIRLFKTSKETYFEMEYPLEKLKRAISEWEVVDKKIANDFKKAIAKGKLTHQWNAIARHANGILALDLTEPPTEDTKAIVIKVTSAFNLAYQRFHDLQKAEAQTREALIEAALERTRTQSMLMQHSDELNVTAQVFHQQLQLLGIDSEFSYLWLPNESEQKHKFWATWSETKKGKTLFNNKAVSFPLDKKEPSIAACYKAWESGDIVHLNTVKPNEVKNYFATWDELLSGVTKFKPKLFPEGLYYIDAYMKYGCFGIMTRRPLTEAENHILSRFSKEFERTYSRFLGLQKAEAQAREAQIETALEKVRSRTMAMQKGEELQDVVVLLYKELIALGVTNFAACGYVEINEETNRQATWVTNAGGDSLGLFHLPLIGDVHFDARYEAWKNQQPIFRQTVAGKERRKHLEYAVTTFETEEAKHMVLNQFPEPCVFYCFNFSHGYLHLVSGSQLTQVEEALLARFTKVFQQTYARFLDLKKAEAQARESEIELALERVRSRSMAMQKSDELLEAAELLWNEITKLGIESISSGYVLMSADEKIGWNYMPNPSTRKIIPEAIGVYHDKTDIMRSITKNWKKQKPLFVVELNEKQTITHQTFIAEQSLNFHITAKQLIAASPPELKLHSFNFKQGYLLILGGKKLSQEQIDVMLRFTKVFQQTYTRFLDLQKAEAQAKEAKIEMALEKVRSRTMAMQHSDELPEAANVLFMEVQGLGIPAWSAGYNILSDDKKSAKCIMSSEGEIQAPFILPLTEHSSLLPWHKAIKHKDAFFEYEQGGKDLIEHYKYMASLPELNQVFKQFKDAGISLPTFQVNHLAKFTNGFLLFITYERVSEAHDIFKRFAKVFEQTYTRFLDLQRAEAQARTAQISLAVERVRAKALAMHKSEEIMNVVAKLKDEVMSLDIPDVVAATIFLNEGNDKVRMWDLSTLEKDDNGYDIPFDITFKLKKTDPHLYVKRVWENTDDYFVEIQNEKDFKRIIAWLRENDKIKIANDVEEFTESSQLKQLYHAVKKLNNGKLVIDLMNPPSDEMETILTKMGAAFDLAYKRFEDLQKAESQAKESQIEAALERVRSRSLSMHESKEMLSVIDVVSEQMQQLNLNFDTVSFAKNNQKGDFTFWITSKGQPKPILMEVPSLNSRVLTSVYKAKKKGVNFIEDVFTSDENRKWGEHLIKYSDLKYFPESIKKFILNTPGFARSSFFLKNIDLYVGNYRAVPFTDEENTIFKRFAQVFEQSYTRFLDLKKAEAQAREAQIEASLEKVRSRSLAMHKPDELQEVVTVVAEKLQELGVILDAGGVIICTYFPDNKDVMHWISAPDFSHSGSYFVPYFDDKTFNEAWDSKNSGESYFSQAYPQEDKNKFFEYAFEHSDYRNFPDDFKQLILQSTEYALSFAWQKNSAILIPSHSGIVPSESDAEIIKRFAKVFEQAYIRFMDLQKAEEQARESQIEVALERVRSRTMAMQKSEELAETSVVVFKQLLELGISPNRLFIGIIKDNATAVEAWATNEDGSKIEQHFKLYASKNKSIKKMIDGWKQHKKSTIIDMKGKELQEYFHYLNTVMHIPFIDGLKQKRRIQSIAYFSGGLIGMASPEEQPKKTIELLERFAAVFNLTYTRFNDLKIAEANTEKAEQDLLKLQAAKKSAEEALSELQATQKQLIQSEKMASLGELTAGIAHEIQNPLNFVNNFSEVSKELLDEMLEELENGDMEEVRAIMSDVIQNLEKINHHGKRADGIVKGMLQHSRASGDKKEQTNINALADEYFRLAYHGLRAKDKSFNAHLETDYDDSIKTIAVISQDIGRVMLNLFTNAFYAVDEKKSKIKNYKPTVSVSTKKLKDKVLITVKDNGNGIPKHIIDKIFQPFFTTKPTGKGTGLGLSLSYDIIKAHKGELKVETKEGEGTTFTIELPNE